MRPLLRSALALAALLAAPLAAQPVTTFNAAPEARGTAYFVFAEPGAPTIEIIIIGQGARNGIFRLQDGTSLIQALALAGGTARSDSTRAGTTTATVRVHRNVGGTYRVIYQATSEDFVENRADHPDLQGGDTIETVVDFEPAEEPGFTFLDGLNVASRVASFVSLLLLLNNRR